MFALLAALLAASAPTPGPPAIRMNELYPRIFDCAFRSHALGREARFVVVLPKGYDADDRTWPVVYFLHGAGRNRRSLVDHPKTRAALLAARFATVHPDGDAGWWVDSPVRPESRYQSFVSEVVRAAEARFRVSRRRAGRGLAGWSMGGYGATLYAETHPSEFAALATILPLVDFPNPQLPKEQNHAVPPVLGRDPAAWPAFNPLTHAGKLRGLALYHTTGRRAFDWTMNVHFDRRLTELGIPHTFVPRPGAHTWSVVEAALPDALGFLERSLRVER